jgi:hypothetical protein
MNATAFVIGNGTSRKIFPIEKLKGHGIIYGCNAIYRDHPDLCDKIFAVNQEMYQELVDAKNKNKFTAEIIGPENISKWNYILENDDPGSIPDGLKLYRQWQGGDAKRGVYKTRDFSQNRGSGCSAVLDAAESGHRNILILGFDILGAKQWEINDGGASRLQNNVYADSPNYPTRYSMKAYMKYEWLYHLTQTFRRFPNTNFYFINRREYIEYNPYLRPYFRYAPGNIKSGIYADLKRFIDGESVAWTSY